MGRRFCIVLPFLFYGSKWLSLRGRGGEEVDIFKRYLELRPGEERIIRWYLIRE